MTVLDALHPGWNAAAFAVFAALVWMSGQRLASTAEAIARHTGLGLAFVGALFLGGATSLPEIATSVTAGMLDEPDMAAKNLLGGVVAQSAVIAVVDALLVTGALTYFAPSSALLLSGVLLCLQLSVAIVAIAIGDVSLGIGIGLWPPVFAAIYLLSLRFLHRYESQVQWTAKDVDDIIPDDDADTGTTQRDYDAAAMRLYGTFAICCIGVLVGGSAVSTLAHVLARQTGVSGGLLGATAVAIATSLPEVSATVGAVRARAFTLAISNIFGSNALMIALILVADAGYYGASILNNVDRNGAIVVAAIGVFVTVTYLWGLIERRNKTVLGMGVDSAIVLTAYIVGVVLLYVKDAAAQGSGV